MGITWAEQRLPIAAPPDTCFAAISDYETFTEWQDAVASVDVLDRYADGLGKTVRLRVDAKVRHVTYTLRYHYDRPGRIWWDFVDGDGVEQIEGEYLFEAHPEGTLATYRLGIDPGVPVPALVARTLNRRVMKRSVEDLRREAERRHRDGGGG
jgi:uncharacterized membrane protein